MYNHHPVRWLYFPVSLQTCLCCIWQPLWAAVCLKCAAHALVALRVLLQKSSMSDVCLYTHCAFPPTAGVASWLGVLASCLECHAEVLLWWHLLWSLIPLVSA